MPILFILFSCALTHYDLSYSIPTKGEFLNFAQVDATSNSLTLAYEGVNFSPSDPLVLKGVENNLEAVEVTFLGVQSLAGNEIAFTENSITYSNTLSAVSDILVIDYSSPLGDGRDIREVRFQKRAKTCIGLYIAGDNNLNGSTEISVHRSDLDFVWKDLKEITEVSFDKENLIVVVFLDLRSTSEASYSNTAFASAGIYIVEDGFVIRARNVAEPNTGQKEELEYFLNAMHDFAEADRYVLDLWGHGLSLFGVCFDDDPGAKNANLDPFLGVDGLSPTEINGAIIDSKLQHIDVLLFSACLMMDIGVLWEIRESVHAVSGAADYVPGIGSFYGNKSHPGIIGYLSNIDGVTNADVASEISDINYRSFFTAGQQDLRGTEVELFLAHSAVDQSKILEVKNAFKSLIEELGVNDELRESDVIDNLIFYFQDDYSNPKITIMTDMMDLAVSLSEHHSLQSIRSKATQLKGALEEYIKFDKHANSDKALGVSILFTKPGLIIKPAEARIIVANNSFYSSTGWATIINAN